MATVNGVGGDEPRSVVRERERDPEEGKDEGSEGEDQGATCRRPERARAKRQAGGGAVRTRGRRPHALVPSGTR